MFKKYFAHEFKNSCPMPLTICGLVLGISLLIAIGAMLELNELTTLALSAFVVTFYICFFMSFSSIHKTMTGRLFTKSGYLTLTLPVGTHTILLSKILVNMLYVILYIASFFISILLILGGIGLIGDIKDLFGGLGELFVGLVENFHLVLIYCVVALITFLFILCTILFCNSIVHSGFFKKQSKILNFVIGVIFVIVIATIINIEIIPYVLCYSSENGYYIEAINNEGPLLMYVSDAVVHFSSVFWMLLGTAGFYFGSYYLIKNKIDIL